MAKTNTISIPFDALPEAREWKVGQKYHVQMVLKQTGITEQGAEFTLVDATSMEDRAGRAKKFLSGDGSYFGK
jgi:hypothetical protein